MNEKNSKTIALELKNYENYKKGDQKNMTNKPEFGFGDFSLADFLLPITPEILGVTPRYVLQMNAICRSIQSLSATAYKLTAMATALLPADLSNLTAAFSYPEFCHSMGWTRGGKSQKLFSDAVDECMKCVIKIELPAKKPGKKNWEKFTWFDYAKLDEDTDMCIMHLSPHLASTILKLKREYTKINLQDLGSLSSRYAIKIYEVSISYKSMEGQNGNLPGAWYWERSIQDLRELLAVPDGAYTTAQDFRRYAVENPITEINAAGLGIQISSEGIKQGRAIKLIRFTCRQVPKTTKPACGNAAASAPLPLPEPPPQTAELRETKELDHLAELHPAEFADFYAAAMADQKQRYGRVILDQAAKAQATQKLRERHGIQK
jgi:hypothetical protein